MSGDVQVSGPIFDGRADLALKQACRESERSIAIIGASMLRSFMAKVFRLESTPPYYRFKVEARADAPGWKIWDQDVVYGPWLEGTGSRNKTTRFKGYFSFRKTAVKLQARARVITERIIVTYSARWQ